MFSNRSFHHSQKSPALLTHDHMSLNSPTAVPNTTTSLSSREVATRARQELRKSKYKSQQSGASSVLTANALGLSSSASNLASSSFSSSSSLNGSMNSNSSSGNNNAMKKSQELHLKNVANFFLIARAQRQNRMLKRRGLTSRLPTNVLSSSSSAASAASVKKTRRRHYYGGNQDFIHKRQNETLQAIIRSRRPLLTSKLNRETTKRLKRDKTYLYSLMIRGGIPVEQAPFLSESELKRCVKLQKEWDLRRWRRLLKFNEKRSIIPEDINYGILLHITETADPALEFDSDQSVPVDLTDTIVTLPSSSLSREENLPTTPCKYPPSELKTPFSKDHQQRLMQSNHCFPSPPDSPHVSLRSSATPAYTSFPLTPSTPSPPSINSSQQCRIITIQSAEQLESSPILGNLFNEADKIVTAQFQKYGMEMSLHYAFYEKMSVDILVSADCSSSTQPHVLAVMQYVYLNDYIWIESLAVRPEYERRGIGAFMVSRAQQMAYQRNKRVLLYGLNEIMPFYRKTGFVVAEKYEEPYQRLFDQVEAERQWKLNWLMSMNGENSMGFDEALQVVGPQELKCGVFLAC